MKRSFNAFYVINSSALNKENRFISYEKEKIVAIIINTDAIVLYPLSKFEFFCYWKYLCSPSFIKKEKYYSDYKNYEISLATENNWG